MPFEKLFQYTIPSSQRDFGLFEYFLMSERLKVGYFFYERIYYMQSSLIVSVKKQNPPKKPQEDGLF